ncbi:hypothetical protein BP5796_05835 [Coleophoma crateriformis]|uniref:DUF6697 domain-containing protein n=1 Tax=Coleophoma crateriformis TaxID=565419 RepID=A0A3D8RVA2_9HELO|nr:hypothetical protein BP5796_05835 [Coleophoma crateriformis]
MQPSANLPRSPAVPSVSAENYAQVRNWLETRSIRENLRKLYTESAIEYAVWAEGIRMWSRVWLPSLPPEASDDDWTRDFIYLNHLVFDRKWNNERGAELEATISKLVNLQDIRSGVKRPSLSGNRRRPHEELRDLLIETIESVIGRPVQRRNSRPVDPRFSDPTPPNFYVWRFSPKYPSFPPIAIGRWSAEQQKACRDALKQAHLAVVTVDPENAQLVDPDLSQMASPGDLTSGLRDNLHAMSTSQNSTTRIAEAAAKSPAISMPRLTTPITDDLQSLFSSMQDRITEMLRHESQLRETAEARIALLEDENEAWQQNIQGMSRIMEEEYRDLTKQMEDQCRNFEAQMEEKASKARERAIDDLESSRRASDLSHLEQLDKVRDEAYKRGLAERYSTREHQEASFQSRGPQQQHKEEIQNLKRQLQSLQGGYTQLQQQHEEEIQDLKSQLQSLRDTHTQNLQQVREEAKKEGRNMAFRELSISPDDGMNNLVGAQNELNTSRKIRELKTIFQNWNEIPQRALPSYMLPEGHTPGDKNLYLLAKLSKEVDAKAAGQLLQAEIDNRQKHIAEGARCLIVQNADIKRVLKSLRAVSADEEQNTIVVTEPSIVNQQGCEPSPLMQSSVLRQRSRLNPSTVSSSLSTNGPLLDPSDSTQGRSTPETAPKCVADVTNLVSVPVTADFPRDLQSFSPAFLREHVGGNESMFAKVSASMKDRQLVAWPEILRINPNHHEFAPELGSHGALTLVDGRVPCGVVGDIYPAILRKSKDKFDYIGHYKLACRVIVAPSEWRLWPVLKRAAIAKEIAESTWGETLLTAAGLMTQACTLDDRIDDILGFFEKEKRPYLRMNWTVLQFDNFNYEDYKTLVSKLSSESAGSTSGLCTSGEEGQTTRKRQNSSQGTSRDTKRSRLSLDAVVPEPREALDDNVKPELPAMDFGDLYNASPEPQSHKVASPLSLPDSDLPRLGHNPSSSQPGKKALSSKEAGIYILKSLKKYDFGALGSQVAEREAGHSTDWPTWDWVNKITSKDPHLPQRYSAHDPYPTLAEINKFLKMLSLSRDRPENDWQLYLWPVGEEQLSVSGCQEKVVTFLQWHQRAGHRRDTKNSNFTALFGPFSKHEEQSAYAISQSGLWTATIRPFDQHGKELIIWSPSARAKYPKKAADGTIFHEVRDLPGMQKSLIDLLHPHNERLSRIWFGAPKERCDWFQAANWLLDTFDGPKAKLPQTYEEFEAAGATVLAYTKVSLVGSLAMVV